MRPVVLVDLDDTLIPDVSAARAAISLVLQEFSLHEDVDAVLAAARETWRANAYRGHREVERVSSWEALWADFTVLPEIAEALSGHAVTVWRAACPGADAEALNRAYVRQRSQLVVPFVGAVAALDRLAEGHSLWLATDGCRSLQREKLRRSGFDDRFERIFVSGEVGRPKGSPEFAEALIKALDGREVCLLAGDSSTDLALAAAGGWPAVHICGDVPCAEPGRHSVDFAGVPAFCRC
ncbi:HAD family hydrolase [Kutzneria chonburiensis]|uniref:HAD family hydrolase n=1 Tax=Kutzneria chonburiensis TaxID=1483604 RepID=A0ABV6MKT7_9PSEU|nr:HAD family hydrolase [Kutzneria chonburiensis]